eukprot:10006280-Karenia_brevis.AAC.1
MPIQLLSSTLREFAFDMVHLASSRERTLLNELPSIDHEVFKAALLPAKEEHRHRNNVVRMVATLSAVDESLLHRFNAADSDLCSFCHACPSSVHHCIWHCSHPALVEARADTSDSMETTLLQHVDCLPTPLLYGLPPKMSLLPCGPWWSNVPLSQLDDTTVTTSFRAF